MHLGSSCFFFGTPSLQGWGPPDNFLFKGREDSFGGLVPGLGLSHTFFKWQNPLFYGTLRLSWSKCPKLANLKMYSEFSRDFLAGDNGEKTICLSQLGSKVGGMCIFRLHSWKRACWVMRALMTYFNPLDSTLPLLN